MRVDMEMLLSRLKGSELLRQFESIAQLELYTLLTPPYSAGDAKELMVRAQSLLGVRLAPTYMHFLQCCDGGLLFTNQMYSLLCPECPNEDLVEMNRYLHRLGLIPAGSIAIGETNYGAYIIQCTGGKENIALWDGEYIAQYENLGEWLEDAIEEARFLQAEDALIQIFDEDDYITEDVSIQAQLRENREANEEGAVLFE